MCWWNLLIPKKFVHTKKFGAPPNWIALAPRPTSHSRLDRRCAYPRIALIRQYGRYTLQVGERWVNPLPDEASRAKPKHLHKSLTICNNCRLNFKNGIAVWSLERTSEWLNCWTAEVWKFHLENCKLWTLYTITTANWLLKIEIAVWSSGKGL